MKRINLEFCKFFNVSLHTTVRWTPNELERDERNALERVRGRRREKEGDRVRERRMNEKWKNKKEEQYGKRKKGKKEGTSKIIEYFCVSLFA